jgi:DNA-binding NtrC family response regulator
MASAGRVSSEQSQLRISNLREDPLNDSRQLRNVLIIEDEPAIRNVLCVLLAGLGCEGDIAHNAHQALAMIEKRSFDAVLLDLRCSEMPAGEMASALTKLRPSLVGKVLVITGEVSDPQTMEMIKKNCWPHIPRQRVMQELWGRLRSLLGISKSSAQTASPRPQPTHPPVD